MEKDRKTEPETMPAEAQAEGMPEQPAEEKPAKQSGGSAFEGIYDQLPDISVRSVDRFIVICLIALAAVIVIGVLKANHVF